MPMLRRHREMKVPVELYAKVCDDIESFVVRHTEAGDPIDDLIVDKQWARRFLSERA